MPRRRWRMPGNWRPWSQQGELPSPVNSLSMIALSMSTRRAPTCAARSSHAATCMVLVFLSACAAKAPTGAVSATEFEGVPMAVSMEEKPDATFAITVRETTTRSGTNPLDDIRLYQRVASRLAVERCGAVLAPELQSETSKQGVVGRDYVFKCAPGRLDRSQPQTLMQQR